jgi:thiamine transport system ATP-binding protein
MLVVNGLQYEYQHELFKFDLTLTRGTILSLMGPSGAGKSTLLSLLAGFIEPKLGEITVDGHSVVGLPPYKRPFSMLFQEHNLFAHLTVRENIGLGLHPGLKLSRAQKQRIEEAAEQVAIESLLDRLPEQLSGGQRQRVALARCFVQSHPIWLLDEPFSALDPVLRAEMLALVKQLATERHSSVVMVTHHISDARAIASHYAFIAQHRVQDVGPIEQLNIGHTNSLLRQFVVASE